MTRESIVKEITGTASGVVAAPMERCFELLVAIDRYPEWHPEVVREVEIVERDGDGLPTRARAKLHVARGPLVRDFDLLMAIDAQRPRSVSLAKLASGSSEQRFDVDWRLRDGAGTRIELALRASLNVSRLIPLGGIGDWMAAGFIAAARRELSSSSSVS